MTTQPEDDDTKAGDGAAKLPSVIIDQGLIEEARARDSDHAAALAGDAPDHAPANGSSVEAAATAAGDAHVAIGAGAPASDDPVTTAATPTEDERVAVGTRVLAPGGPSMPGQERAPLSFLDADRFAASIRPSWEPSAPTGDALVRFSHPPPVAAMPPVPDEPEPAAPSVVPPKVGSTAGLFVAAGCVVGLGALLVFAIAGGETERPKSWRTPAHDALHHGGTDMTEAARTTPAQAVPVAPAPAVRAPAPEAVAPSAPLPPATSAPSESPPVAAAPPPASTVEPPPPAAPLPPGARAPESAVTTVRVRVSTVPTSALLRLDGSRVSNPYDEKVAPGGVRVFEASASGYEPRKQAVSFSGDQTLRLVLERRAPAPSRTTAKPTSRAANKRATSTTRSSSKTRTGAAFVADSPY